MGLAMAVRISPVGRQQFFDNQGRVAAGYKLFTYEGGTSTKLATYTSSTGLSQNSNPIVLNSAGRTPNGLWLTEDTAYKFVLAPANDTDPPASPVWTEDNIISGDTPTDVSSSTVTASGGSSARTLAAHFADIICVLDYGATGAGVANDRTAISNAATAAATRTLYFPAGTYRVGSNLTIAAGVEVWFEKGAKLKPDAGVAITINGPIKAGAYQVFDLTNAGSSIAGFGGTDRMLPEWWGVTGDGTTDDTAAFVKAVAAAVAASKILYLRAATYMATVSIRGNNTGIIGPGSSSCMIKHPNTTIANVLELGDTASGNSATAYTKIVVRGITLDGNRSVISAPGTDLVGHGLPLTKISYFDISDVRAVNCHNAGFGAFINSNYGKADVYVENCGNVTITGPGFDLNSSKYGTYNVVSKDCFDGGRVLDNCFNNIVHCTVHNAGRHGFVYNNQSTNESYGNLLHVTVDTCVQHGMTVGPNCHNSTINLTVKSAGDRGIAMPTQTITTKTFDGSSAGVVDTSAETITITSHGWTTGAKAMYSPGAGGTAVGGLTAGQTYWLIRVDNNTIKVAASAAAASAGTALDLTSVGVGASHTFTENLRPQGNTITLISERTGNQGIFLGGDGNLVFHTSNQDGRSGAQGSSFAVDVNGNRNVLHVVHMDSDPWHVRGIAVRAGATGNVIASYQYDNTADPYNDAGTSTQRHGQTLSGSATYNPSDLANGTGETTTVTVTGAVLGDFAEASFSLDLSGLQLTAYVSAANTVSCRFQNGTGGNVNLASGTLRARVRKNI